MKEQKRKLKAVLDFWINTSKSWTASGICSKSYLIDPIMNVVSQGIRDQSPWYMFAYDIVIGSTNRDTRRKTGIVAEGIRRQRIEDKQKEDIVS